MRNAGKLCDVIGRPLGGVSQETNLKCSHNKPPTDGLNGIYGINFIMFITATTTFITSAVRFYNTIINFKSAHRHLFKSRNSKRASGQGCIFIKRNWNAFFMRKMCKAEGGSAGQPCSVEVSTRAIEILRLRCSFPSAGWIVYSSVHLLLDFNDRFQNGWV